MADMAEIRNPKAEGRPKTEIRNWKIESPQIQGDHRWNKALET